jgi:hypothetical protein
MRTTFHRVERALVRRSNAAVFEPDPDGVDNDDTIQTSWSLMVAPHVGQSRFSKSRSLTGRKKPGTIGGAQTGKLYKQNYFFGAASPVRGHSAPDDWL